MNFNDLYSLFTRYTVIEQEIGDLTLTKSTKNTKEKINKLIEDQEQIKFNLELPYKAFNLLVEAKEENVYTDINKVVNNDISIAFKYGDYLTYLELSKLDIAFSYYYDVVSIIKCARDNRLEVNRLYQVKQQALSKLTAEEKDVLGL